MIKYLLVMGSYLKYYQSYQLLMYFILLKKPQIFNFFSLSYLLKDKLTYLVYLFLMNRYYIFF